MKEIETLGPKDQIIYIPNHLARLDYRKPEKWLYPHGVQPGFIVRVDWQRQAAVCRYWYFEEETLLSIPYHPELRTKANGEWTPIQNLVKYQSVEPSWVEKIWKEFVEEDND